LRLRILAPTAFAAVLVLAGPASAFSLPPDPTPIDDGPPITWTVRPTIWHVSDAADAAAFPEGSAHVECVIDEDGKPGHCVVADEDPPGRRLGGMMIEIVRHYRAAITDAEGRSCEGRKIRFGFRTGRPSIL
jgi:hypothetical protein